MGREKNLKSHFKKINEENLELVEKSISELNSIGSEISFANVSKISDMLAVKSGLKKGLGRGALYKNKIYCSLIKKERVIQQNGKSSQKRENGTRGLSEGDLGIALFELKEKNARLEQEKRVLKDTLINFENREIGISNPDSTEKPTDGDNTDPIKMIIITLFRNDLIVFDDKTSDMRLAAYGDLLITYESAVKIIGKDFVDDLRTHKGSHVY